MKKVILLLVLLAIFVYLIMFLEKYTEVNAENYFNLMYVIIGGVFGYLLKLKGGVK